MGVEDTEINMCKNVHGFVVESECFFLPLTINCRHKHVKISAQLLEADPPRASSGMIVAKHTSRLQLRYTRDYC